uniref:Uncharacterized protein n=1 Tax=Anguilla anguilla TaxID=7936 RepID=A0A0E9VQ23_ANGAN
MKSLSLHYQRAKPGK